MAAIARFVLPVLAVAVAAAIGCGCTAAPGWASPTAHEAMSGFAHEGGDYGYDDSNALDQSRKSLREAQIYAYDERPHVAPSGSDLSAFILAAKAGTDLVRYDPQLASRQLLNQPLVQGYARTPGGRTVSAHAADRIVHGGPGRPPTTLENVDRILDKGTEVRYDPVRDTIRVRASNLPGRPYVVVSASDPNHIVTVMVPR